MISGRWGKIDETPGSTTTLQTLENPRIADQNNVLGTNVEGYIVWEKKQWTSGSSGGHTTYAVSGENTKIGIAAFDVSGSISAAGRLISVSGGGAAAYIPFSGFSGTAPERPSVAVGPDKSIWVSFYSLDLPTSGIGSANPAIYVYISKGYSSLDGANHISYSFNNTATLVNSGLDPAQTAFGRYDPYRGYVYANFPDKDDSQVDDFDYDFVSGPSVEVVSNPPTDVGCDGTYWVGVAYPYTFYGSETLDSKYPYRSMISFNSLKANSSNDDIVWITRNRNIESDRDPDNAVENAHNPNNFFFPILTYATSTYTDAPALPDLSDANYASSFLPALPPKYFVLGYMAGDRVSTETCETCTTSFSPRCFKYVACHTGISYDNQTFSVTSHTSGVADEGELKAAESFDDDLGWVDPAGGYWGTKIGVCGRDGELEVHTIWHFVMPDMMSMTGSPAGEELRSNVARGILLRGYLKGAPMNDASAYLTGTTFPLFDPDGSGFHWGDYGYFNFYDYDLGSYVNQPTDVAHASSFSPYSFISFDPVLPSSYTNFPFGLRYAQYGKTSDQELGLLEFSNQRRIVATGSMLHAVYSRMDGGTNDVLYSSNIGVTTLASPGPQLGEGGSLQSYWSQELKLNVSGNNAYHPAIAVYQKGNGSDFDGKAAIGVTWVEQDNSTSMIYVKFKTREFNQCTGDWNSWSDEYVLDQHTLASGLSGYDGTTAVIAPFVTPQASGGAMDSSALLGWNIVWTTPDAGTHTSPPYGNSVHSRMWLRTAHSSSGTQAIVLANNEKWGTYLPQSDDAYTHPSGGTHNPIGLQPMQTITPTFNILVDGSAKTVSPYSFPTITSTENKFTPSTRSDYYNFDLAYTTDGTGAGMWTMNENCDRSTAGGHITGQFLPLTSTAPVNLTSSLIAPPPGTLYQPPIYLWERNPCITVNSSGQSFISWEAMYQYLGTSTTSPFHIVLSTFSSIQAIHKPWTPIGNRSLWLNTTVNSRQVIMEAATDKNWDWLLDPSITGYPKSSLGEDAQPQIGHDQDPGAVDMLYWVKNRLPKGSATKTLVNELHPLRFSESAGSAGKGMGSWLVNYDNYDFIATASNSQRAFGQYNSGPAVLNYNPPVELIPNPPVDFAASSSYAIGNVVSLGSVQNAFTFQDYESLKGTFPSQLPVDFYRGEEVCIDSNHTRFIWGKVYVGDTSSLLPMREVMLHWAVDSTCDSNITATRDSVFRSEVFDLPVGANIQYWRGMFLDDSLSFTSVGKFYGPSQGIGYTIELVSESGAILDTIERPYFSPYHNSWIVAKNVTITNSAGSLRNVFLRVRGNIGSASGQQVSSMLEDIIVHGDLPSYADTGFTVYKKGYPNVMEESKLVLANPYPNPVGSGNQKIAVPFIFLGGYPVKFQLLDELGREVASSTLTSSGSWQECKLPIPSSTGVYLIRVFAGNFQQTVTIQVMK